MTDIKEGFGIIGFFDILGYSSLLENNTTRDASRIIIDILLGLKDRVREYQKQVANELSTDDKIAVATIIDRLEWLVFSDTVLLALEYDLDWDKRKKEIFWSIFITHCSILYSDLFTQGLPVRGKITHGDFLLIENCFAGKSIINAYRHTETLELAAVILSDESKREMETTGLLEDGGIQGRFLHEYLVPMKNEKNEKRMVLIPGASFIKETSDIRQLVLSCFWKHKKDIPRSVIQKVDNTEMFFRSVMEVL